jgi:HTH-type transcriptional regulator/antitoxin HigA
LAAHGIRFVIVEPLFGSKVDGMAMWLSPGAPAIGMSLRYDRIDSFWHTLCHELSHIANGDEAPLDTDLTDQMEGVTTVNAAMEHRADEEAADMLVPSHELNSFIRRVGPLYSKDRIVRFANRIRMHPGIIVGQLQHRQEIGYSANREMLFKIREFVTSAALTDGWGHTLDQRIIA